MKNIRQIRWLTLGAMVGVMCGAFATWATTVGQSSAQIPYTGHLQQNGGPVTGAVGMRFSLYPSALSTTVLWQETHDTREGTESVDVVEGEFSVLLGRFVDIDAPTLRQATLFLGIDVLDENGAAIVLGGRQQVGSMPFAWGGAPGQNFTIDGTLQCAGCVTDQAIATGAVGSAAVSDGSILSVDIANGAVSNADLGFASVTSDKIADGVIIGADLAGNLVYGSTFTAGALRSFAGQNRTYTTNLYNIPNGYIDRECPSGSVVVGISACTDCFLGHLRVICKTLGTH